MSIDKKSWIWEGHYNVPAEIKSIKQCFSHGCDHRAYNWTPRIDPLWSDEQKAAYWAGFENRSQPVSGN